MFYSSKNSKLSVNNSEVIALDAQINLQANLSPLYLSNQRHSFDYRAADGIGGTLSVTYYITGHDPIRDYISDETTVLSGNFGGLNFNSGYLKSYQLNGTPNKEVIAAAEIVFFDDLKGGFNPNYTNASNLNILNFSDVTITDPSNQNIGNISNIDSLRYSYTAQIQPMILAGAKTPDRVVFGPKEISASFTCDNLSGDLPVTGKSAGVTLNFSHPFIPGLSESVTVYGSLFQRTISASNGSSVKSNISVKQNYTSDAATITLFDSTAQVGNPINISGTNFNDIIAAYIGDTKITVIPIDDGHISGIVPLDAIPGLITIVTKGGSAQTNTNFTPIYNSIQVNALYNPTGSINSSIRISGANFYRIDNVVFNSGVVSDFNVISPMMIEATVPEFAAWGPIWVQSNLRGISGLSPQKFVPVPIISSFTPQNGNVGDFVIIEGRGFSGISGLLFNNLPNVSPFTSTFTVLSNTGISGVIPTGNFRGNIKVLGQSGVQATSQFSLSALPVITGLSPFFTRTGTAISILGSNFYPDILFPIAGQSNTYLVTFNDISGNFIRVNSNQLTGLVPYNASSGAVYLYDTDQNPYPSTGFFSLEHNPPKIAAGTLQTGFSPNYAIIQGSDFFNISSVVLSGTTGNLTVDPSLTFTSQLGDVLSFQYPIGTGGYYHLVVNTSEGSATGYSGIFLRSRPTISSITPASGAVGSLLTFSGREIYVDSNIYFNNTSTQSLVLTGSNNTGNSSLQFYVPAGARTGLNDIILFNQCDWVTGSGLFTLISAPSISGFNPISGAVGDTISISGSYLGNVTGLYFGVNSNPAVFSPINNTGITAVIPSNASTDYIRTVYNGGNVYSTGKFTVISPNLSVTSIVPTSGYWGDNISISGNNLNYTYYVGFSGVTGDLLIAQSNFSIIGTTGINIAIPAGTLTGPVKVKSDRFTAISSTNLSIIPTPYISYFSPNSGVFGDTISISGSNLSGCQFLFSNINQNKFVKANSVSIVGGTGATFTVPREIVNGSILVSGLGRAWAGTTGVFYPVPTIFGFTPHTVLTGASVVISGINAGSVSTNALFITGRGDLQNIQTGGLSLNYNQISGNGITDLTTGYTLITATINNNFVNSGALFLLNNLYSGVSDVTGLINSDIYKIIGNKITNGNLIIQQGAPVLAGFSPSRGSSSTIINLTGVNLLRTTGVYLISGSTISQATLLNSGNNSISFQAPGSFAQRSGQWQVYTQFGNATTTSYFTELDIPVISGIFPTQGKTGDSIFISGLTRDITGLYMDVSSNSSYSVGFTTSLVGTVYQISGIVPPIYENLERNVTFRALSEAGTAISNPYFLHPGETQFWGNLSGKFLIGGSGIAVTSGNCPLPSGAILTLNQMVESGRNFSVVNMLYQGNTIRIFSWTTGT